jgi:hexosaminidase
VSDGFFFLPPGETKQVTFKFDPALAGGEEPKAEFLSYNNSFHELPPFVDKSGDLALDKNVTSSSSDILLNGPDAVTDGNPNTRWLSAKADPQWIMIDLEKVQAIGRVKLVWEKAYATSYSIQVSDDGTSWADIYSTTTGMGGTEELTGLKGNGRYIRMLGTQRVQPSYGYSLLAFEVYGP